MFRLSLLMFAIVAINLVSFGFVPRVVNVLLFKVSDCANNLVVVLFS